MLNHLAPEFVPAAHQSVPVQDVEEDWDSWEEHLEDNITQQELEELEATAAWVQLMVELEEAEREHMIAQAMELAPAAAWFIEQEMLAGETTSKPRHKAAKQQRSKAPGVSRS